MTKSAWHISPNSDFLRRILTPQAGKDWYKAISEQSRLEYKVQYLTEYCSGPREATVVGGATSGKMTDKAQNNAQQQAAANKLPLEVRVCV